MAGNDQKLSLQRSIGAAATARALAAIERSGQALPCRVIAVNPDGLGPAFVTVEFETQQADPALWPLPPITLPKAESQWLRAPTQKGDYGFTVPVDTLTDGVSGQGGIADLTVDYGNMSSLLWIPCGSSTFSTPPDPNMAWVNGPAGAVLSDAAQTASVTVAANRVAMQAGDNSVVLDASGLTVTIGGAVFSFGPAGFTGSDGVTYETHVHGGVQTGAGVTLVPQA